MVRQGEPFAFVRFADGEGSIIDNNTAWLRRRRASASWEHIPKRKEDEEFRQKLIDSLSYNDKNYFIGIPCRQAHQRRFHYLFDKLKGMTTIPEEQLTFSTVFKDYNWKKYLDIFVPLCTNRECYLVSNEFAKGPKESWLQFKKHFSVPRGNAHLSCDKTYDIIKEYIDENKTEGAVFLFAAGPGTNVIIHKLWKENKHNTYIDIGSTLDSYLFKHSRCRGKSRVYLRKNGRGYKPWKWG